MLQEASAKKESLLTPRYRRTGEVRFQEESLHQKKDLAADGGKIDEKMRALLKTKGTLEEIIIKMSVALDAKIQFEGQTSVE